MGDHIMGYTEIPKIAFGQPITPDDYNAWFPENSESIFNLAYSRSVQHNLSSVDISSYQWQPLSGVQTTVTTTGGLVFVHFVGSFALNTSAGWGALRLVVDGQPYITSPRGETTVANNSSATQKFVPMTLTRTIPDLEAGEHNFAIEYRSSSSAANTLFSSRMLKLIVKEIS